MNNWKITYIDNEGNRYSKFIDAKTETQALKQFYEHKPWDCEMVVGVSIHDWRKTNDVKK